MKMGVGFYVYPDGVYDMVPFLTVGLLDRSRFTLPRQSDARSP